MPTPHTQYAAAQFFHMLKETCALHCLLALHVLGPLPVSQRAVMDLTGFDDEAVRKGLNKLLNLGLAICTGDDHRTNWQLGPAAFTLPLPLDIPGIILPDPTPVIPESASFKEKEEEEKIDQELTIMNLIESSTPYVTNISNQSHTKIAPHPLSAATSATSATPQTAPPVPADPTPSSTNLASPPHPRTPAPLPASPQSPLRALRVLRGESTPLTTFESSSLRGEGLPGTNDQALRHYCYLAFEAANVYLQFRRPLADTLLADDGPAGLRQTLGWLCYAQRRLPHVERGAVVYISLRDRLPCDPAYLPPPELPFDLALAWALRGGEPEPASEPDVPEDENDADDRADQTLSVSKTLRPSLPDSPANQLWCAVLDRLSRELPASVLDSQLRPARLVSVDDDRCLLVVPTPQSRDWLAARLAPVLQRALSHLLGRPIRLEIQCVAV